MPKSAWTVYSEHHKLDVNNRPNYAMDDSYCEKTRQMLIEFKRKEMVEVPKMIDKIQSKLADLEEFSRD